MRTQIDSDKTTLGALFDDSAPYAISNGYAIKAGTFNSPIKANTLVLGAGNLLAHGVVDFPLTPSLAYDTTAHDHQIFPGDILLRARGSRNASDLLAVRVDQQALHLATRGRGFQAAIPNASLIRIRVSDGTSNAPGLDPDFLVCFLNSPLAQRFFASRMQSSSVSGISRKDLLDLPLHLPSHTDQIALGRIYQLQGEHMRVTGEISHRYTDLLNAQLARLSN